ncbi:MAG: HD domain-containing phosphohydrolase [Acidobacteriota bacterium]
MAEGKPPEERRRTIGIFWILSVLLLLLVVLPLVSYSYKTISISRDTIEESLRERQLKTAVPAAAHLQTLMDDLRDRLNHLKAVFEVYANDSDVKNRYEDLLQRNVLSRFLADDVLLLAYQDGEGGRFTAPWRGLQAGEEAQLAAFITPLSEKALREGRGGMSEVFYLKLEALKGLPEPAVALAVPVSAGGRTVAALTGVFLLQGVQESLQIYSRDFNLFVTDTQGRLIFDSRRGVPFVNRDLSEDPVVQRILGTGVLPTSPVNFNVTKAVEGKRRTFLVTCAPVSRYDWLLFSEVDRENYYAPIVRLKTQSTWWVALSIVGALAVGLYLARLITRPISTLAEVSRDLARGNFQRRADVKSLTEIGDLGRAFNAMADEIQEYIERVEAAAQETQQLFMDSIRAIANALDAKDPYTRGHSERVSAYSMIVGREFGLDERSLRIMEISSLLHDVGKIGIEDRILRKPGALTAEEFEVMKTHPSKGAQILGSIPQMREIIPGIRHHHEKWSGGGYPDGLKGEAIPLLARIIGVADAFDAMTTNRPYQKAMTPVQAANRINELQTVVYDPAVVSAFNRAFQRGLFAPFFHPAPQKQPA